MIEVGSFIGLAAMTQSQITIKNAGIEHLGVIPQKFQQLGINLEFKNDDIIVNQQEVYEIQKFIDGSVLTIYYHPWPGMTPDLLSILLVVATQAKGSVLIHQKMFESRLFFTDKLIDMGIQRGPYSAAAGHELELTLDKIKQHPHGLDIGPLQPSLPERLCTSDGKIRLMADYIVEDLARLGDEKQETDKDELLLIGRRHIRSNNSWMHNSHRLVKGKPRWQLLMHPDDMAAHQLQDQSQVRIRSRVGEVQTQVLASDEVMPGVVSLPHGWGHKRQGVALNIAAEQGGVSCNDLTDDKLVDRASGNSALNGVPVKVFGIQ